MKIKACAGAMLVALAGCGGSGGGSDGNAASNVTSIRVANPHHERLLALDERNRRVGLLRAIRDSRNSCRSVVAGAYQQEYEGLQMWVARCQDERQWAVFIAPSGQVQVRDCTEAQQLSLPACRPFEAAPMEALPPIKDGSNR